MRLLFLGMRDSRNSNTFSRGILRSRKTAQQTQRSGGGKDSLSDIPPNTKEFWRE